MDGWEFKRQECETAREDPSAPILPLLKQLRRNIKDLHQFF